MKLTGKQNFLYIKYLSRTPNGIGQWETTYDIPRQVSGQVQAVPRNLFEKYGLDFQGTYLTFYISKDILDVQRDVSGDQIKFGNDTYKCLSETDWFLINGWTGVMAVKINT
jgi:hypothetical protein